MTRLQIFTLAYMTVTCVGWIYSVLYILILAGNLQNPSEQLDVVEMLSSLPGKM